MVYQLQCHGGNSSETGLNEYISKLMVSRGKKKKNTSSIMFNKLPDNSNNFLQTDLPLVYTVIISYNPTFVKNKYLVEFLL